MDSLSLEDRGTNKALHTIIFWRSGRFRGWFKLQILKIIKLGHLPIILPIWTANPRQLYQYNLVSTFMSNPRPLSFWGSKEEIVVEASSSSGPDRCWIYCRIKGNHQKLTPLLNIQSFYPVQTSSWNIPGRILFKRIYNRHFFIRSQNLIMEISTPMADLTLPGHVASAADRFSPLCFQTLNSEKWGACCSILMDILIKVDT